MTYTVQIASVLDVPPDDVLAALSAGGVRGTLLETDPYVRMDVDAEDADGLGRRVGHALESLIATRRWSLVPERIGVSEFVLRPPVA
jgi:hypothetical protein